MISNCRTKTGRGSGIILCCRCYCIISLFQSLSDVCVSSAALCIAAKWCKICLWCVQKSIRNVSSPFRLVPFSTLIPALTPPPSWGWSHRRHIIAIFGTSDMTVVHRENDILYLPVLESYGQVDFHLLQLSTNSLPRGAHSSYKLIQKICGFGLCLRRENFSGASAAVVQQFEGFSCYRHNNLPTQKIANSIQLSPTQKKWTSSIT